MLTTFFKISRSSVTSLNSRFNWKISSCSGERFGDPSTNLPSSYALRQRYKLSYVIFNSEATVFIFPLDLLNSTALILNSVL